VRYNHKTNTDEKVEGTGLGMNIAMQIEKLHRGTLVVESKEQVGTSVVIDFPLR
jgi:signal transduction histidine kinase